MRLWRQSNQRWPVASGRRDISWLQWTTHNKGRHQCAFLIWELQQNKTSAPTTRGDSSAPTTRGDTSTPTTRGDTSEPTRGDTKTPTTRDTLVHPQQGEMPWIVVYSFPSIQPTGIQSPGIMASWSSLEHPLGMFSWVLVGAGVGWDGINYRVAKVKWLVSIVLFWSVLFCFACYYGFSEWNLSNEVLVKLVAGCLQPGVLKVALADCPETAVIHQEDLPLPMLQITHNSTQLLCVFIWSEERPQHKMSFFCWCLPY